MPIWSAEIKELETLYTSIKGHFPDLEKDLEHLIKTDDENVAMLYSRRCLEIIITDLCESELKRSRKTEPLKGIIDKLQREEKVPSHIIASMHSLNSLSTFGTHPKEFNQRQVKPVLLNLTTIIEWYLNYKDVRTISKVKAEEEKPEIEKPVDIKEITHKPNKKLVILLSGLFLIVVAALIVVSIRGIRKSTTDKSIPDKSVAILPFSNLSNDPEQEYFSDGMVDAILDHLFKIGDLKVISRTSSMRYKDTDLSLKQIANELNVSAILEGSVQKYGNNVRITVQLIDTKTDTHLWSDTYDKDLSDIFSIQSEVAQNIARELKATLTSRETGLIQKAPPTTSQLAYDFYLKGNDYLSKAERLLAIDMFSKAIQEDSLFTSAYARRAQAHILYWWVKRGEWQGHDVSGKADIKKGLQLNPESPEIRFAEAVVYYQLDRNYDKSLKILAELKTESPNMAELYVYSAYNLRRQGKWEESISQLNKGIELDPFNANSIDNLAETYQLLQQYDNQLECARQGLALIPDYKNFRRHIFRAYLDKTADLEIALNESGLVEKDVQYEVYFYTRQYDKLIELINKEFADLIIQDSYSKTHANVTNQFLYEPQTYKLALIYYLRGNISLCKTYADSTITHLKGKIKEDPNDERYYATLGKCHAFIGNNEEAIACGEKAINLKPVKVDAWQGIIKEQDLMEIYLFTGNYDLAFDKIEYLISVPSWLNKGDLMINPIFDNLRNIPRFQKIID
jgi:TolB-like protein